MFLPLAVKRFRFTPTCLSLKRLTQLYLLVGLHYLEVHTDYILLHAETLSEEERCPGPLLRCPLSTQGLGEEVRAEDSRTLGVAHVPIHYLQAVSQISCRH